jgi:hypothetical protein
MRIRQADAGCPQGGPSMHREPQGGSRGSAGPARASGHRHAGPRRVTPPTWVRSSVRSEAASPLEREAVAPEETSPLREPTAVLLLRAQRGSCVEDRAGAGLDGVGDWLDRGVRDGTALLARSHRLVDRAQAWTRSSCEPRDTPIHMSRLFLQLVVRDPATPGNYDRRQVPSALRSGRFDGRLIWPAAAEPNQSSQRSVKSVSSP